MSEAAVDDIVALLPPLLTSIDALAFVARYLNPPDYDAVLEAAGTPDEALRAAACTARRMAGAAGASCARRWRRRPTLRSRDSKVCAASPEHPEGLRAAYRALRHAPRAQEALYPLAASLPPVSQFFLDAAVRDDAELQARLDRRGGQRRHRRHACRQRARQPRRVLDVRAGVLHAPIAPGRW